MVIYFQNLLAENKKHCNIFIKMVNSLIVNLFYLIKVKIKISLRLAPLCRMKYCYMVLVNEIPFEIFTPKSEQ